MKKKKKTIREDTKTPMNVSVRLGNNVTVIGRIGVNFLGIKKDFTDSHRITVLSIKDSSGRDIDGTVELELLTSYTGEL